MVKRTRRPRELWYLFTLELEGKLVQCSNANIASRCALSIDKEVGIAILRPNIEPARTPRPHSPMKLFVGNDNGRMGCSAR